MADEPTIDEAVARLTNARPVPNGKIVLVKPADLRTLLASHASLTADLAEAKRLMKPERIEAAVRAGIAEWAETPDTFTRFNNWTSDRVRGLPGELCRYGADGEDEIIVIDRFPTEDDAEQARLAFEDDDMVARIVAAFVSNKGDG